jgi:hypothetical protein
MVTIAVLRRFTLLPYTVYHLTHSSKISLIRYQLGRSLHIHYFTLPPRRQPDYSHPGTSAGGTFHLRMEIEPRTIRPTELMWAEETVLGGGVK